MEKQPDEHQFQDAVFHKNTSEEIDSNRPETVQRVITNTAAHRVKKRGGNYMVNVYGHSGQ